MGYDVIQIILVIVLILVVLLLVLSKIFYSSLFKPDSVYTVPPPDDVKIVEVDNITGWLYVHDQSRPIIIYFHGYSENISYRMDILELCRRLKMNLFLFDYRGYGHSPGYPSMEGLLEDATSAYNYILMLFPVQQIYLWAESLGCAPATYIASHYPISGMIVYSGFPGVATYLSYTTYIPYPLLYLCEQTDAMPVNVWMTQVNCPVFYMASPDDDMIPYNCSKYLFSLIPHPYKYFCTIGGNHRYPEIKCKNIAELMAFFDFQTCTRDIQSCRATLESIQINSIT